MPMTPPPPLIHKETILGLAIYPLNHILFEPIDNMLIYINTHIFTIEFDSRFLNIIVIEDDK